MVLLTKFMKKSQKFYLVIKRLIGLFGSFIGIIICLPLVYWWVFIVNLFVSKGHPLYVQKRLGKHKKVFGMIKFRSLRIDAPEIPPSEWDDEKRAQYETKFGSFLRKTSLDETPQLLNIFIGHMAFIGPRPGAAVNEDKLIELREKYTPNAFDVRPGLSGLAQVKSHRSHVPAVKAKFDHEYVCNISLCLDIKIFVLTVLGIFGKGKGK